MAADDAGKIADAPVGKQPRFTPVSESSFKVRMSGWFVAALIKLYSLTLRFRLEDRAGLEDLNGSVIWAFWHNRLLTLPVIYRRNGKHRVLCVLTSPSRDGAVVAAIVKCFGMDTVRGSTNKRAAQSLVECRRRLLSGSDLGITPDGPRGPVYVAAPGVIHLSRMTGRPVMPVRVEYSRKWRLKSWDGFQIPRPFARVTVTVLPPVIFGDRSIEDECLHLASLLGGTEPGAVGRGARI